MTKYDRKYLNIAIPAAMEGVFMILLANVDIILVGKLGTEAIAAVSIFTQPRMVLLTLARSLGAALTLLAAECYGRGQKKEAGEFLTRSLFFWGIILLALHGLFYGGMADILLWMGAEANYLDLALRYADITLLAVFITGITTLMQGVVLGFGLSAVVLRTNLVGNIINLVLSAVLIFGLWFFPALGVQGAAIGTVLGAAYTLIATWLFLRREKMLTAKWLPTKNYLRRFLPVFGGVFGEQGFERVGMVLYTRLTAELGTVPYAVHAVCMNFCDFYYSFAGGLGKASMVLTGQAHGRGDEDALRRCVAAGVKWSLLFSMISFLLTFFFREEVLRLYTDDAEMLALGGTIMILVAAVSFPEAHALVTAGVLRGSGKTSQVAAYSFVSVAVLRPMVTWFFIYELNLGLMGAWLALALDQSIRAAAAQVLLWQTIKKQKSPAPFIDKAQKIY